SRARTGVTSERRPEVSRTSSRPARLRADSTSPDPGIVGVPGRAALRDPRRARLRGAPGSSACPAKAHRPRLAPGLLQVGGVLLVGPDDAGIGAEERMLRHVR